MILRRSNVTSILQRNLPLSIGYLLSRKPAKETEPRPMPTGFNLKPDEWGVDKRTPSGEMNATECRIRCNVRNGVLYLIQRKSGFPAQSANYVGI